MFIFLKECIYVAALISRGVERIEGVRGLSDGPLQHIDIPMSSGVRYNSLVKPEAAKMINANLHLAV